LLPASFFSKGKREGKEKGKGEGPAEVQAREKEKNWGKGAALPREEEGGGPRGNLFPSLLPSSGRGGGKGERGGNGKTFLCSVVEVKKRRQEPLYLPLTSGGKKGEGGGPGILLSLSRSKRMGALHSIAEEPGGGKGGGKKGKDKSLHPSRPPQIRELAVGTLLLAAASPSEGGKGEKGGGGGKERLKTCPGSSCPAGKEKKNR